jgi:hypothetical protein
MVVDGGRVVDVVVVDAMVVVVVSGAGRVVGTVVV